MKTQEVQALHDRIAKLEAELVSEAARTAEQKLRADQISKQHDMQCAMHKEAVERAMRAEAKLAAAQQGVKTAQVLTTEDLEDMVSTYGFTGDFEEMARVVEDKALEKIAANHPATQGMDAPAHPAEGVPEQGGTPGPWRVRKRTNDAGEVLDCFVTAPDCQGRAYDAHILGDDYDSIELKLADAELIVAAVNAFRGAATHPTPQGLEQFIEQVGDVHFQRCRVGSATGAIRWDIEFGNYGSEVSGKTLQEAIAKAKALAA